MVAGETVNVFREIISLERINVVVVAVLEGGGGGKREEGGGSDNWKELHQKVKKQTLSTYGHMSLFWHPFF